jgi:biotin carboxyl carrier protein
VGSVVGLVETMKIFNDITADVSGQVVEVHVRRGDLVAAHTPLISVDPTEGARWLPAE